MKLHLRWFVVAGTLGLIIMNMRAAEPEAGPVAEKKPVVNEYHGTKVTDDYQWLEDEKEAAVKSWSDAENKQTRAYLDSLPSRDAMVQQLTDWYAKTSPSYSGFVSRDKVLFGMKFQPPKQQPMLVRLASVNDLKSEKVLVDPNQLDSSGKTTIDWFKASLDGKLLAVSLSTGGS
ncbi:MAG: S9 family peptidase, partial [Chthoniobacterales bacterium]